MSELSNVINLTKFHGVFHSFRKAVDNPTRLRAQLGKWGGDLDDYTTQTRPKIIIQAI
jgi:hypothetical protein